MPPPRSILIHRAPIAQLVELRTFNPQVVGSIPTGGTGCCASIGRVPEQTSDGLGALAASYVKWKFRTVAGPSTVLQWVLRGSTSKGEPRAPSLRRSLS